MCGYIQAHITERETTYLQLEALTHALRRSRDRRRKVTEKRQRRNGIHGNGSRAPTRKASGSVAPSGRLSATTGRGRAYASGGDVEDQEDSPSTFSALASHRRYRIQKSRGRGRRSASGDAQSRLEDEELLAKLAELGWFIKCQSTATATRTRTPYDPISRAGISSSAMEKRSSEGSSCRPSPSSTTIAITRLVKTEVGLHLDVMRAHDARAR